MVVGWGAEYTKTYLVFESLGIGEFSFGYANKMRNRNK